MIRPVFAYLRGPKTFFGKAGQLCKKQLTLTPKGSKLTPEISRNLANSIVFTVGRGNNMSLRQRKAFKALAVFLAFSFAQVYVQRDRKSTRLNSSHTVISYAVFCLKKKHYQ